MAMLTTYFISVFLTVAAEWRPWDGATAGFSAGLCGTPNCGGSYTKTYNVQACRNAGYNLRNDGSVEEPNELPHPFGQGAQPALNECSNPGELRLDTCPNILKFADIWKPEVDGRTFMGSGDNKLLQGFGHAFTKVADGLHCGGCAAVRAKRRLTDGGYNYMIIMRVDVTDDISPEVDEVTAQFGDGVVPQPAYNRIPYEYKIVDCETGRDIGTQTETTPVVISTESPTPTPTPTRQQEQASPTPVPAPRQFCTPIGDCGAFLWCNQDAYSKWCAQEGLSGQCPKPFCQSVDMPNQITVPSSVPTPSPHSASTVDSSCVPSGEGLYSNKQMYRQVCNVLTNAVACVAYPMCKWKQSLLSSGVSKTRLRMISKHGGNAFIQRHMGAIEKYTEVGREYVSFEVVGASGPPSMNQEL